MRWKYGSTQSDRHCINNVVLVSSLTLPQSLLKQARTCQSKSYTNHSISTSCLLLLRSLFSNYKNHFLPRPKQDCPATHLLFSPVLPSLSVLQKMVKVFNRGNVSRNLDPFIDRVESLDIACDQCPPKSHM